MNGIGSIHLVNDSSDLRNTHAESEGAPRGGGSGRHGVRGASGDVRARGPDLGPRAPLSPPVFHPPETPETTKRLLRVCLARRARRRCGGFRAAQTGRNRGRRRPGSKFPPGPANRPPRGPSLRRGRPTSTPEEGAGSANQPASRRRSCGPRHQGGPRVVAGRARGAGRDGDDAGVPAQAPPGAQAVHHLPPQRQALPQQQGGRPAPPPARPEVCPLPCCSAGGSSMGGGCPAPTSVCPPSPAGAGLRVPSGPS